MDIYEWMREGLQQEDQVESVRLEGNGGGLWGETAKINGHLMGSMETKYS